MVPHWVLERMLGYVMDDVGRGDVTTECLLDPSQPANFSITVREGCVLAGRREVSALLNAMDIETRSKAEDGTEVRGGTCVIEGQGPVGNILGCERTVLNILGRMCGIATLTREVVERARAVNPRVRIAATRKTTPGFGYFEKRAVMVGGGEGHRWGLDDMVLIKDNHLEAFGGGVGEAVRKARGSVGYHKRIEVEVTNLDEALEAVEAGADIVMLDNFTPSQASEAYKKIKAMAPAIEVEVSGGIGPDNVGDYASSADVISMGYLTHSYRAVDVSLSIKEGGGNEN